MDATHRQLLRPEAYPDRTSTVTFKETHISRLYLTDTRVYKLKKPLNLGFLNFSTLELRRHFCEEEVRLNSRFAPNTYLGVVELHLEDGQVHFDGPGATCDYAVCMQRLPDDLMLDQMIAREAGELPEEMGRLAAALNTLFDNAEICQGTKAPNVEIVARNCRENFEQTATFSDDLLDKRVHKLMGHIADRDLEALDSLFRRREEEGFVRDGHGDLHSGNICMTDPIQIYDCIEFNRRFRIADVASDLAFLLMDLEFQGRRDLAERLLSDYQRYADDHDLGRLLPFYKRYRAWVRGKVDGILAGEVDVPASTKAEAAGFTRRYFNLAMGYALDPTLLLTSGLMGTGKTVLAKAFASATGAMLLRSDVVRKELAGLSEHQASPDEYRCGIYAPEMSERTYRALEERATQALSEARSVIVDASFSRPAERQRFLALAAQAKRPAWLLYLTCPDQVARKRLDARTGDASDGRTALLDIQKRHFSPVEPAPQVIRVDSTQDVDYNVQKVLCRVLSSQEDTS